LLPGIGDQELTEVNDIKYSNNHNSLPDVVVRSPGYEYNSNNSRIQVGYANMASNASIDPNVISYINQDKLGLQNISVPLSRARSKDTLPQLNSL
jgi:hypothetical protein